MASRIGNITFASEDPARLANFWAAALGYEVELLPDEVLTSLAASGIDPDDAAAASDPSGLGPRLWFERKAKTPTTTIPIHLDLDPRDTTASTELERLLGLGATLVEERSQSVGAHTARWYVLNDPEGNGFCLQIRDDAP